MRGSDHKPAAGAEDRLGANEPKNQSENVARFSHGFFPLHNYINDAKAFSGIYFSWRRLAPRSREGSGSASWDFVLNAFRKTGFPQSGPNQSRFGRQVSANPTIPDPYPQSMAL
jgi:hypothetical protein